MWTSAAPIGNGANDAARRRRGREGRCGRGRALCGCKPLRGVGGGRDGGGHGGGGARVGAGEGVGLLGLLGLGEPSMRRIRYVDLSLDELVVVS